MMPPANWSTAISSVPLLLRAEADATTVAAGHIDGAATNVELAAAGLQRNPAAAELAGRAGLQQRRAQHGQTIAGTDRYPAAIFRASIDRACQSHRALVCDQREIRDLRQAIDHHIAGANAELTRCREAGGVQRLAHAAKSGSAAISSAKEPPFSPAPACARCDRRARRCRHSTPSSTACPQRRHPHGRTD
jgi:hypothetical protein